MRARHAVAPRQAACLPWPPREQSDVDPAGCESLVGKLAADLCDVVSHEAPEVDLVELGLAIALEARRRGARANA